MQHTPTPWAAQKARTLIHIGGYSGVCEISVSARHIHEDRPGRKAEFVATQEANAAFIVRACNAYDELVSLLGKTVSWVETASSNYPGGHAHTLVDEIKAVLAKAEGK